MTRFRLYFDKDKENAWLNQMAQEGYAMTGFFAGFYTFEKCEPGAYIYQVDFGNKFFSVSNDYREFMSEQGIEIMQLWGFWIILRKPACEGSFQLYTDVDSSIEHYTKIRNMFKIVTIIELLCFLMQCFAVNSGHTEAVFFSILIGAFVLALMNVTLRTNRIIKALKERKGDFSENENDKISPLFLSGLLLNSCALVLSDNIAEPVKLFIQVAAIILILIGLYRSKGVFRK